MPSSRKLKLIKKIKLLGNKDKKIYFPEYVLEELIIYVCI